MIGMMSLLNDDQYDPHVDETVEELQMLSCGDPLLDAVDAAIQADEMQMLALEEQFDNGVDQVATMLEVSDQMASDGTVSKEALNYTALALDAVLGEPVEIAGQVSHDDAMTMLDADEFSQEAAVADAARKVKAFAIRLWETIKGGIRKAIAWARGLWKKYASGGTRLYKNLKEIAEKFRKGADFKEGEWQIDVTKRTKSYMTGNSTKLNPKAFNTVRDVTTNVYKTYMTAATKSMDEIDRLVKMASGGEDWASLSDKVKSIGDTAEAEFKKIAPQAGDILPGGKSFKLMREASGGYPRLVFQGEGGDFGKVKPDSSGGDKGTAKVSSPSKSDAIEIALNMMHGVKMMNDNAGKMDKMSAKREEIIKMTDAVLARIGESGSAEGDKQRSAVRKMLSAVRDATNDFATKYASYLWTTAKECYGFLQKLQSKQSGGKDDKKEEKKDDGK